jgi:hypothetical protein
VTDRSDFEPDAPPTDEPLTAVVARLVETGRNYAEAEIDKQKLRAALVGSGLRTVAILGVVGLILLFGTLVTLMIGLVFALAPLLTPLGATAVVSLAGLAVAGVLFWLARRHALAIFRKVAS